VGEVIDDWIEGKGERETNGEGGIVARGAVEADQGEYGQSCTDKNVGGVERFLGEVLGAEAPITGPEVDEAAKDHAGVPGGVGTNVVESLVALMVHVGDFADALIFGLLSGIVVGVQIAIDPGERVTIVADVEFHAESAADGNEFVEKLVVADHPRSDEKQDGERSGGCGNKPGAIRAMPAIAGIEQEQRDHGKDGGFGEDGDAGEEPEGEPGGDAAVVFEIEHPEKKAAEEQGDEGSGPSPVSSVVDAIGRKRPAPAGPLGDAIAEALAGEDINGNAGSRRDDAVEDEGSDDR